MGARSLYHIGCFINVIKHGRALWPCIIADLQRRRREGGLTGKGGWRRKQNRKGVCRRERGDNKDMRLAG